jgi:hypothetical protein
LGLFSTHSREIKANGRYCVEFKGRVVSRHRSLEAAQLVRARVERNLLFKPLSM